jgi:hypothetical protein
LVRSVNPERVVWEVRVAWAKDGSYRAAQTLVLELNFPDRETQARSFGTARGRKIHEF